MSALGDLLDLLHGAAERAGPTRLTVLEWNHLPRMHETFGLSRVGSTATITVGTSGPSEPETTSSTTRLHWQSTDRAGHARRAVGVSHWSS